MEIFVKVISANDSVNKKFNVLLNEHSCVGDLLSVMSNDAKYKNIIYYDNVILVNHKRSELKTELTNGDEVFIMQPVVGG